MKSKRKSHDNSAEAESGYRQALRQADEIIAKNGAEIRSDNWQQLAFEWFAPREPDRSELARYMAAYQDRLGVKWAREILRMEIFLQVQDYTVVVEHYDRAFRSFPRCALADAWVQGYILRHTGDFWRARQMCLKAAAELPVFSKPSYELGFMNYLLGDFQGASEQFDRAAALVAPDDAEAGARIYYNRGLVRFALGDKQGATADAEKALRCKPDYHQAQVALRAFKGKSRWIPW